MWVTSFNDTLYTQDFLYSFWLKDCQQFLYTCIAYAFLLNVLGLATTKGKYMYQKVYYWGDKGDKTIHWFRLENKKGLLIYFTYKDKLVHSKENKIQWQFESPSVKFLNKDKLSGPQYKGVTALHIFQYQTFQVGYIMACLIEVVATRFFQIFASNILFMCCQPISQLLELSPTYSHFGNSLQFFFTHFQ